MSKTKGNPSQKRKKYKVEENKIVRLGRACPKCGAGVFLAEHKDHWHCGRCSYTEFKRDEKKE